jgi:hypothetical protein
VWAAVAGGGAILGLVVSGALLTQLSWRSVFGVNVVMSVLALIGPARFVPESADPKAPRIDVVGAVIAVLALVALVFSVVEAPTYGWLAARTIVGFALSAFLLVGFASCERRAKDPLLDPAIFRRRSPSAGSVSISIQFFACFGFTFVILQYLQLVRGDSPLLASLSVLPVAGAMSTPPSCTKCSRPTPTAIR